MSQYFPPEGGPASARIGGLTVGLKRLGHEVVVLTGYPNYPIGKVFEPYRVRPYMRDEVMGIPVLRTYLLVRKPKSMAHRLLNYLSFMCSSALFGPLLARGDFDVVIASSPPLFVGLSGLFIASVKRCPFVFDVRDIWPQIAVDIGEIDARSASYKVLAAVEGFIYKRANQILVVTPGKAQKLAAKGVPLKKIAVVSNGVDDDFVDMVPDIRVREKAGIGESDFVVVYAGLFGKAQGMDDILGAAAVVQQQCKSIKFLLIGDGPEKERIVRVVKSRGLSNVIILPYMTRSEVRSYLACADVGIVTLKNDELSDSIPSKLYEYMGIGLPVILSASGEARQLLQAARGGIVVQPGNPEALARAVLALHQDPLLRREFSQNGASYVKANYLRSKVSETLERILLDLTSKK